jgi:hypothetical protein
MARRYSVGGRFSQPDPSGGSYDLSNPQSLNRYAYVGNDPVNFRDPSGMEMQSSFCGAEFGYGQCGNSWGGGSFAGNGWGLDPHPGKEIIKQRGSADNQYWWAWIQIGDKTIGWFVKGSTSFEEEEQNPLPITVRSMSQKYAKDFLKALGEAEKRLTNPDCASLYGKSSTDLINMLENTEYRVLPFAEGGPKYDPNTGETKVTGAGTYSPTSVFINEKGNFFNNRMFVPGKTGIQTLDFHTGLVGKQFSALLLLHELGHQVGLFGPDAKNQKLNEQYTRQVKKACF